VTDADQELFEERAAIREYDGGLSREMAETLAKQDVILIRNQPRQKRLFEDAHG